MVEKHDGEGLSTQLLAGLSTGVVFTAANGIIGQLNPAAEEMLELTQEQVVGRRIDMLPLRSYLYKVLSENSREIPVEMVLGSRMVVVRTIQLRKDDGELLGEMTELREITAERKERRQREEFVAMMTHDLKSPITVLSGYLQMIKAELFARMDTTLLASVKEIERCQVRLLSMIEDILDSYRIEVGLLTINREFSDIKGLLEKNCEEMQREAEAQGVTLTMTPAPFIPPVEVDQKQISRVIANLLANAVKFTPKGGRVTLTPEIADGFLRVRVTDTGIGIPAKDLPHVFKKYYRTEKSAGYKGTGLGLAIAKAIVEGHGGTIVVESDEGKGTTFTFSLPLLVANT